MTTRPVIQLETLGGLDEETITAPVRFAFLSPRRGGPALSYIRYVLQPKGRLRLSGTTMHTFADVDPGLPEDPVVTLDTIVRSDAEGLERMILSVLPHVDEIVLGVDERSDEETRTVVRGYADRWHNFHAVDIGLSNTDWNAGKIHFANARNIGRKMLRSPWALVIDSDEYLKCSIDLRKLVREAPDDVGAFEVGVQIGAGFTMKNDVQRLARSSYRWTSPSHNQLLYQARTRPATGVLVVSDTSLRTAEEQTRRHEQRDRGIEDLVHEAGKGDLTALFHLVKHKAARGEDVDAVAKMAEDYRKRIFPHDQLSDERAWVALSVAFRYYNMERLIEAEQWALRALFDGPRVVAFCLLGDIAEGRGDLVQARGWYECACALTAADNIDWPSVTDLRHGRLAGIKLALEDPETASVVYITETDDAPAAP